MDWDNDIANQLPTPRDDEPSSLRQDIIDELSDHLQSSLLREQHKTINETEARQNVLNRFGNVKKIAYQLWFDALKEKIMSQRITLGLTAILSAACLLMCWMVWNMNQQNQKSNNMMQVTTTAMQKELQELAGSVSSIKDATVYREWVPMKLQLVSDDKNKPLMKGYQVVLGGGQYGVDVNGNTHWIEVLDELGMIDFPLLRPSTYRLIVTAPWGERMTREVEILSGKPFELTVICPALPLPEAKITFSTNLPDEMKDKNLWVVCDLTHISSRQFEKAKKEEQQWQMLFHPESRSRVLTGSYQQSSDDDFAAGRTLLLDEFNNVVSFKGIFSGHHPQIKHKEPSLTIALPEELPALQRNEMQWTIPEYFLKEILIVTPKDKSLSLKSSSLKGITLNVLARTTYAHPNLTLRQGSGFGPSIAPAKTTPQNKPPKYEADLNRLNHWKIELPENMFEEARKKLKELATE